MNSYNNTLLIISTFLAIFFIGCQTYENKEASENGALSLKDIGKDSSKFNLISGYDENNNQQKRQVRRKKKVSSRRPPTTTRKTTKKVITRRPNKVTTKRPTNPSHKYITMKYQLYRDINELRGKYYMPPLQVNTTLSTELQDYVMRYITHDKTLEPLEQLGDEVIYFCPPDTKYEPIKYWSKYSYLLNDENIELGLLDLDFTQLIWKSSTHIGCGVFGGTNGIFTYCRITPKGNIQGQYGKNVFNRDN
uniref:SCP domain-containing protein n=1 Tax=Strongyloides venezuelensis TaxID=75913 RepID=A0A0K0EZV2_STRVS